MIENSIDLLKKYWRKDLFRPMQKEVIDHYNCGHDTIVLLPTGGGKSLCYQLPAVMKKGATLVICPIISIMQDQIIELGKKKCKSFASQRRRVFLRTGGLPCGCQRHAARQRRG